MLSIGAAAKQLDTQPHRVMDARGVTYHLIHSQTCNDRGCIHLQVNRDNSVFSPASNQRSEARSHIERERGVASLSGRSKIATESVGNNYRRIPFAQASDRRDRFLS